MSEGKQENGNWPPYVTAIRLLLVAQTGQQKMRLGNGSQRSRAQKVKRIKEGEESERTLTGDYEPSSLLAGSQLVRQSMPHLAFVGGRVRE